MFLLFQYIIIFFVFLFRLQFSMISGWVDSYFIYFMCGLGGGFTSVWQPRNIKACTLIEPGYNNLTIAVSSGGFF